MTAAMSVASFIVVNIIREESQYFTGRILHIQGKLNIGNIGEYRATIHGRNSKLNRAGNFKICHGHAAIHRRTNQGGGITECNL